MSPFGSHEEWWEKPSEGFRSMALKLDCEWGVVLFLLSEHVGLWIERLDFDSTVLKEKKRLTLEMSGRPVGKGLQGHSQKQTIFYAC